ncbi:MAG: radical SAM protein [Syntrophothermus sp.]
MLRVSAGTAHLLGLKKSKVDALPTTAYLMTDGKCLRDCGFCPQSRSSTARTDLLSRVTWPTFQEETACAALRGKAAGNEGGPGEDFKRICLQVVDTADWQEQVRLFMEELRGPDRQLKPDQQSWVTRETGRILPPVCIACHPRNLSEVREIFALGAERLGIALDAATPRLYAAVKGGSWQRTFDLLTEAALEFPGRISTHLIVGLGETEAEMVEAMDRLIRQGVTIGLFAFTPIRGTALEDRPRPSLGAYRRIQAARWLLLCGAGAEKFSFDGEGRLTSFGLTREELRRRLAGGEAFQTSGCPDCNRPYYNESPGGVIYNYPRPLTAAEAARALDELEMDGATK